MTDTAQFLKSLKLTDDQQAAAAERRKNVIVTAGAGSGKTRTLVARYLALLAEGLPPRRVTAITFTEKAAREMRSRVRSALTRQVSLAQSGEEKQRWSQIDAQMDSARIGTIHSLCAEILRAHPAEAGVDPRFGVLDEGLAATLRAQAVTDTLTWLVEAAALTPLLSEFSLNGFRNLLGFLLNHRLEAQAVFASQGNPLAAAQAAVSSVLQRAIQRPDVAGPIQELSALQSSGELLADAGDKLTDQVDSLLASWNRAEQALADGQIITAASWLFQSRRNMGGGAGKKTGRAKGIVGALKTTYDKLLDPLLGGAEAKDPPPDEALETLFFQSLPLVQSAFAHLLETYQAALRLRQALDFDDLEAGAARLLSQAHLCRQWQNEIGALLVDEFQDTNARQNQIVMALCGEEPGRLFVVGDPRQSIYRFRQADVTVFKNLTESAQDARDRLIPLDQTYRAHSPLLDAMGSLLNVVMGSDPDPERPYYVPYSPLKSDHAAPRAGMLAPHIEFVLGGGEDAAGGRPAAARALAQRLFELRTEGQVQRWDDVTLLFRASTGFPAYEKALEDAGIPFVTVAGQGFYDRPEIRDVLNLLRALADPWDDLAMAGLLRSPAFGLSDAALYHLRCSTQPGQRTPFWAALCGGLDGLAQPDRELASRAVEIIEEFKELVDRLPVADLLKRLVDRLYYRAILASAGAGGRLWRNLDKLLADAQASGLVNVRAFLEYLQTLRDVGAREGEAPSDAEGAVRLMTIHKAKGLEFPLVVLADAARKRPPARDAVYFLPGVSGPSLAFKFDQVEQTPLLMRLARLLDNQQAEAEEKRVLYVALTRAKEKLLVSGHCTFSTKGGWQSEGWLDALLGAAGSPNLDAALSGETLLFSTPDGHILRVWGLSADRLQAGTPYSAQPSPAGAWMVTDATPLFQIIQPGEDAGATGSLEEPEPDIPAYTWRAVSPYHQPPAGALGEMVHRAIQRWIFPPNPPLLQAAARSAGIAAPEQLDEALRQSGELLERLRQHPIWQEIDEAEIRQHEVPYSYQTQSGLTASGYMDLLYRSGAGWQVIDFKTDSITTSAERARAVEYHRPQMQRYAAAARALLKAPVSVRLCFLDDQGRLSLEGMY